MNLALQRGNPRNYAAEHEQIGFGLLFIGMFVSCKTQKQKLIDKIQISSTKHFRETTHSTLYTAFSLLSITEFNKRLQHSSITTHRNNYSFQISFLAISIINF